MAVESELIEGRCNCRITGDLCIWAAGEIWRRLYPLLHSPEPMDIDLRPVTSCDGAGVQILCQLMRVRSDGTKAIHFCGVSQPVRIALAQAGMAPEATKIFNGEG
jgi:anti-anti-sigma regulatory factor